MKIRLFKDNDAEPLAGVISKSLREVNSKDYPSEAIQEKIDEYSPSNIRRLSETKQILVAVDQDQPVGVAMLKGDAISGVFVLPERTRQGIGRSLMAAVEQKAREAGCESVHLSSSVTARSFYETIGYQNISKEDSSFLMKKQLA
jgi:GNAT superfamily N-acetyltransferase